ncbi:hypothetical protein TNCV_3947701 [Trichonephila clavipes]|nr:hypothetical protein TNCV_3947701 [Trichonephila clavipes]
MNKLRKTPDNETFGTASVLSNSPTVSSEELIAIDDDNVCTALIMACMEKRPCLLHVRSCMFGEGRQAVEHEYGIGHSCTYIRGGKPV